MILINYPEPSFRIKKQNNLDFIFDEIRKRWILLTPEEWVRQNFVRYLIQQKNYPSALIALEKEMKLGELRKRFDILVYNRDHQPAMMVECKGASVLMNEKVLEQLLRYNISIPVEFMIITNGNLTYGWQKKGTSLELITEIPAFTG